MSKDVVDMEAAENDCTTCGAERRPEGYSANGFPTAHLLYGRCGLTCVGLYSGITAVSSALFASMVDGCAKHRDDLLVERVAYEQKPDKGSGLGADAGPAVA